MSRDELFDRNSVRNALKLWHHSQKLGEHPFAQLKIVELQRQQERVSYSDSVAGLGITVRHVLSKAIEQLKPDNSSPDYNNPQWRHYVILSQQYIKERRASQIRDMLGVSESGYFKDQRTALERLVSTLREMEEKAAITPVEDESAESPIADRTPVGWSASPTHNLPIQHTPFIGRKTELERLKFLLESPSCRLLTLVGPGGIGKTRLAIEAARQSLSQYSDGLCWIPLESLTSGDFLLTTIKEVMFPHTRGQSNGEQQLFTYLRHKEVLLILDNFEHLLSHAYVVSELLQHASRIKIITTSRERLNLLGEWVLEISGMQIPTESTLINEQSEGYDAVRLFINAARRHQPDLTFTTSDKNAIIKICQLLDGMPLGIELAADWLSILSCGELVGELEKNFDLLSTTMQDLPSRHRSIRSVFNYSWNLLTPTEQLLFRRLSIFQSSFSRESAESITGSKLILLRSLRGKSLLFTNQFNRYTIHGLLRQYVYEELEKTPNELFLIKDAHSHYFLNLVKNHLHKLYGGSEQQAILQTFQLELAEIRLAWEWAIQHHPLEQVIECAIPLYLVYLMVGMNQDGNILFGAARMNFQHHFAHPHLEDYSAFLLGLQAHFQYRLGWQEQSQNNFRISLEHLQHDRSSFYFNFIAMLSIVANTTTSADTPLSLYKQAITYFTQTNHYWALATTHFAYAVLIYRLEPMDKHKLMQGLLTESLNIRQQINDYWGIPQCYDYLGHINYELGHYDEAERWAQKSLACYQELNDQLGVAYAFFSLGQIAGSQALYPKAQQFYQQCLDLYREYGNPQELSSALASLGYITFLRGDLNMAESYYNESLELSRKNCDTSSIAWSLHNLGDLFFARGQHDLAYNYYKQSHQLHISVSPYSWGSVVALGKLGRTHLALDQPQTALNCFVQAFDLAVQTNQRREAADLLMEIVQFLYLDPQYNPFVAVQLLSLITSSGCSIHIKQKAQVHLHQLAQQLGTAQFVKAQEASHALTLSAVLTILPTTTPQITENYPPTSLQPPTPQSIL